MGQVPPFQGRGQHADAWYPRGGPCRGQGWQLRVHQRPLCRSVLQALRLRGSRRAHDSLPVDSCQAYWQAHPKACQDQEEGPCQAPGVGGQLSLSLGASSPKSMPRPRRRSLSSPRSGRATKLKLRGKLTQKHAKTKKKVLVKPPEWEGN